MLIKNQTFICFDIETTGLNPLNHAILEIGAVKFSLENGITDAFESLISFDGEIPEEVIAIHGITKKHLVGAPEIEAVLTTFKSFIGEKNDILIAHNASFDASFVGYQMSLRKMAFPENPILDTLNLSRKILTGLKSYSLSSLKSRFNIKDFKAHRALDDAKATAEVFMIILKRFLKGEDKVIKELFELDDLIRFSYFTQDVFSQHQDFVKIINSALSQDLHLSVQYIDRDDNLTVRFVLPYSVRMDHGFLYLHGFCYLRNEDRKFRLDRIQDVKLETREFEKSF